MVTADRIVARVTSKQRMDEEEPTILSIGSRFENLRIAGCPVQVDLDNELFTRLGTFASFKKEYTENQQAREMMQGRFLWGKPKADVPEFLRERYNWFAGDEFPESKGIVLCSLVKDVKTQLLGTAQIRKRDRGAALRQDLSGRSAVAALRARTRDAARGNGLGRGWFGRAGRAVQAAGPRIPELVACSDHGVRVLRMPSVRCRVIPRKGFKTPD